MNSDRKIWIKVWGVLVVVFALGCVTGASINSIYRSRANDAQKPLSIRDGEAYFITLKDELDLSQDQAARMRAILDETREQYRQVCADTRPRYDLLRERARAEMRGLLSPSQQQRFDSMVTQEDCAQCPDQKR